MSEVTYFMSSLSCSNVHRLSSFLPPTTAGLKVTSSTMTDHGVKYS